jgi:hypothetical protein
MDWYCQVENKQYGPFTADQLRGFAREGRLQRDGLVKRGLNQPWVQAQKVKGLFDSTPAANLSYDSGASSSVRPPASVAPAAGRFGQIRSIQDCVSIDEKKKRIGVVLINVLVWLVLALLVFSTMGILLAVYAVGWLINRILAEYNVRKLMAPRHLRDPTSVS